MSTLFEAANAAEAAPRPLAERLRPETLDAVVGQDHLLGAEGPIGRMVSSGRLVSTVLWGPPGSGKTTIARLLARDTGLHFTQLSAVFSGVADLRRAFDEARVRRGDGQGTLLFVDEIHRFNRAQQDGFLPVVEDGTVILVGATTENPSFELNPPLLSRCQVLVLNGLDEAALEALLGRAEAALGRGIALEPEARAALKAMADGDGRYVLNLAEELLALPPAPRLDTAALAAAVQQRGAALRQGAGGPLQPDQRAPQVAPRVRCRRRALLARAHARGRRRPALHRPPGSCALPPRTWVSPIPRRWCRALAAKQAYDFVGSPEGELALAPMRDLPRHGAQIERRPTARSRAPRWWRKSRARSCRPSTSSTRRPG